MPAGLTGRRVNLSTRVCRAAQAAGGDGGALLFDKVLWGLPGRPGVWTLVLSLLRLGFNPLVRELRFYRLCGPAKNVTKQIR